MTTSKNNCRAIWCPNPESWSKPSSRRANEQICWSIPRGKSAKIFWWAVEHNSGYLMAYESTTLKQLGRKHGNSFNSIGYLVINGRLVTDDGNDRRRRIEVECSVGGSLFKRLSRRVTKDITL